MNLKLIEFLRKKRSTSRIRKMLRGDPEIVKVIYHAQWIDAEKQLPPAFKDVIVWGRRFESNVCRQAWQARRWTGHNQCEDFGEKAYWEWLDPCDCPIKDVILWMPMPEVKLPK